jgi:ABC-type lipoprotein release transport system permease subunit
MAFGNLVRYKTRSLLTGLSIALGTTAMILGLSMTDGIIRQTIIGFTGTLVEDVMAYPAEEFSAKNSMKPGLTLDDDDDKYFLMFVNFFRNQATLKRYKEIEKSIYTID